MYISENCDWTPYGTDPALDTLVDSNNPEDRYDAAKRGYGLDKLITDKDWLIRCTVAAHGYGLDKLINDEHYQVRRAIVNQGYGLDKLVYDKDRRVREEVANQGYGLDVLIHDSAAWVCSQVNNYLKYHGYKSIEEWAKHNPDKVVSTDVSNINTVLKDFMYKVNDTYALEVYDSIDEFFADESDKSYENNDYIIVFAVDTKRPIIKLEKHSNNGKHVYEFAVKITTEYEDVFNIKSYIESKGKFNQLLNATVNALKEFPQFSKYVAALEECL